MSTPANREIDFAFVSCSCRACERAGEAKLHERVEECSLNAGGSDGKKSGSGGGFSLLPFAVITMGLKVFFTNSWYSHRF